MLWMNWSIHGFRHDGYSTNGSQNFAKNWHHSTHVDHGIHLEMALHYGNQTQLLQNQSQLFRAIRQAKMKN